MRKTVIALVAALATLAVPAAASAACPQKYVRFSGDLALPGEEIDGPPGAPVEGNRAKVGGLSSFVATSDTTLRYRKVAYKVEEGSSFSLGCFKPRGSGFVSGKGSFPLLALGSGSVDVKAGKRAAPRAGVSMRYGLFHADHARGSHFTVDYKWVELALGRGRATLEAISGAPVGFSPGSVAALQGTCQAGEKMIVDWKGVRSG